MGEFGLDFDEGRKTALVKTPPTGGEAKYFRLPRRCASRNDRWRRDVSKKKAPDPFFQERLKNESDCAKVWRHKRC